MIIIPIDEGTLPIITAISGGGIKHEINPEMHHSFIYHGVDTPFEIVPTVMIGLLLVDGDYDAVVTRIIVKE